MPASYAAPGFRVLSVARKRPRNSADRLGAVVRNRQAAEAPRDCEERFQRLALSLAQAQDRLAQSEAQLRQAQKMEAVGRLVGAVAHDFNNLLTAISGYSDFLLGNLPPNDASHADVEEIKKAAARAVSLTRQLLAFSRKQTPQWKVLDLNAIVADMQKMLARLIGEDIELTVLPTQDPACARVDPGSMEQVILNLAVNARDAMPKGGRLTIGIDAIRLDEAGVSGHATAPPGDYVVLFVTDTGCGMNAEVQSRLFEPFFTTKERDTGTGLGLSTVHGIVKQSGGHIIVHSEEGKGTSFKLYLPRVTGPPETDEPAPVPKNILAGRATLLLVEDEKLVQGLVQRILVEHGFAVLKANSGEDALAVCMHYNGPIHLMLTDMVLPKMSGPDLAARLAALRPETAVLFMSGYTDHDVLEHGALKPGQAFIQKPFTAGALVQKIREALGPARRQEA